MRRAGPVGRGRPVTLTLTPEERGIVRKTLGHYLDDLRRETTSTDNPGMNAWLNRQAQLVQRLMTRLGASPASRTTPPTRADRRVPRDKRR